MSVYDELSSLDTEALSQIDDGADIVGTDYHCISSTVFSRSFFLMFSEFCEKNLLFDIWIIWISYAQMQQAANIEIK